MYVSMFVFDSLYVCVMYPCPYMFVGMSGRLLACLSLCMSVCLPVFLTVCVRACMHVRMDGCLPADAAVSLSSCVYACIYVFAVWVPVSVSVYM